jgi:hypothetical protein
MTMHGQTHTKSKKKLSTIEIIGDQELLHVSMQTAFEISPVPQDQIKCIHYTASFSHFILPKHNLLHNNMSPTDLSHKKHFKWLSVQSFTKQTLYQ